MNHLRFNLNGHWVEERGLSPTTTLLRYLRDQRQLTGTKEGCAEGDCGACTVAVAEPGSDGTQRWCAVNACLLLLPMVQGKHVLTVEALRGSEFHPAQTAMAKALGSQCGYCTPGVVMSLFEATYRDDLDAGWKLDDQLCGNLCRCTGYRSIREAAQTVAGTCPTDAFSRALARPNESMRLDYEGAGQRFFTPAQLDELFECLERFPQARLVNGGTDLGLDITKRFARPPVLVSLEQLGALKTLELVDGVVRIGAGVTVAQFEAFTAQHLPSVHRMVRYFGARQVKRRATVGGNLCSASPIGDLAPVLLSLEATAVIVGRNGERRVAVSDFFTGYRQTCLERLEILARVELELPPPTLRACAYKVSKRRELDISTVSAAFSVSVDGAGLTRAARFAYGGMAATPARARATEAAVIGQPWTRETVATAAAALATDFTPMSDHRGSAAYRSLVARNLLLAFYEETLTQPQPPLLERHTATAQLGARHG